MLALKDIPFGSTDAKNELLSNSPDEISRFLASFVEPPSLAIEKFYHRQKYFIVGLKGTGKTALLRYVSLKLEENENSTSSFVLFKSDVDEDLKKDFSHAVRVQLAEENSDDYDGDDYETVWRWFIYRKIAAVLLDGNVRSFQENSSLSAFIALVNSETLDKLEHGSFLRLVPRIRKGTVEISRSPKLGLEFDWDESGHAKVKFNDLVRQADEAFKKLDPNSERLNIFFDELELNYASNKQYQRDTRLVRDLIVSIERLNATCKAKGFPVCLYAALRSEVLNVVDALGKEINKPVADFGSIIQWNRPGLDAAQQPLLNIIEHRINSARRAADLPALSSEKVWEEYFPMHIHEKKPQAYILHNSWYRPRDVVRLLISVQDQYPNEKSFILQGIEAIRKSYSTASWVELTEELKARYKPREIDGIKNIFYGFRQISSFSDLTKRAEKVAEEYADTKTLLDRTDLRKIMIDLYRIGVIGNIDKKNDRMRFCFRGDDEIIFDWDIFVHNALKAHLSI